MYVSMSFYCYSKEDSANYQLQVPLCQWKRGHRARNIGLVRQIKRHIKNEILNWNLLHLTPLQRLVRESLSEKLKQIYSSFLHTEYDTSKKLIRHDTIKIDSSKLSYSKPKAAKTHRFLESFSFLDWNNVSIEKGLSCGRQMHNFFLYAKFSFPNKLYFYYFHFINICFQTLRVQAILEIGAVYR